MAELSRHNLRVVSHDDSEEGAPVIERLDPVGIAELLRATRERLGLDLRSVAEVLRIRHAYLLAMEDGRFEELPGPTYAVGFVRAYSDYLGLDGAEIVDRFKAQNVAAPKKTELVFPAPLPEGKFPGGLVLSLAAVLAVAAYAGWYYLSSRQPQIAEVATPAPVAVAPTPAPIAAAPAPVAVPAEAVGEPPEPPARAVEMTEDAAVETAATAPSPMAVDDAGADAPVAEEAAADPSTAEEAAESELTSAPAEDIVGGDAADAPVPATDPPVGGEGAPEGEAASGNEPAEASVAPSSPDAATRPSMLDITNLDDRAAGGSPPEQPNPSEAAAAERVGGQVEGRAYANPFDGDTGFDASADEAADRSFATATGERLAAIPASPGAVATPDAQAPRVYGEANTDARIVLRAVEDSWVQVRDGDNNILLTRILHAGDSYRVPNRGDLFLLTGNAGALEILVDGGAAPSLGPMGAVRRDVPLDPELLRADAAR